MNELSGTSKNSPSLELLLTLVTCGIYGFFWYYKMGSQCSVLEEENGMRVNPIGVLCLVLAVFGLGIISIAILQNEINTIIEENYY